MPYSVRMISDRYCICCYQTIETEEHFLLDCCFVHDQRVKLFASIHRCVRITPLNSDSDSSIDRHWIDIESIPRIDRLKLLLGEHIRLAHHRYRCDDSCNDWIIVCETYPHSSMTVTLTILSHKLHRGTPLVLHRCVYVPLCSHRRSTSSSV